MEVGKTAGSSIKGITVEIDGDTRNLTSALKNVNGAIVTTKNDLKQVERLLKLDPKNTELLAQKQRLLSQRVEATANKLQTLKTAASQAKEQLELGAITQGQYDALQREIIETEKALEDAKKSADSFNASLAKISATASTVADKAGMVAQKTKGLSLTAAGLLGSLGAAAYSAVTAADDLNTLAKQSGFTTEELQKMSYASDLIDTSMEDIVSSAAKLRKSMVSTSKDTQAAFDTLGVSVKDANGHMRDSSDVYWDVVDALSRVTNETERDQLAMQLLGKSADSLAGIVDDGGAALRQLGDEAERAGLIMSQDTLDGLNAVNDQIDTLKATSKALLLETGAKALEAAMPVLQQVIVIISQIFEWIGSLNTQQISMLVTILAIVAAISPVAGIISSIASAISALIPLIGTITAFCAANPIVIMIAAVVALFAVLVATVIDSWDEIKAGWQMLVESIKAGFQQIKDDAVNTYQAVVEKAHQAAEDIRQKAEAIVEAVVAGFQMAWAMAQSTFESICSLAASIANAVIGLVESAVNAAISRVNAVISVINSVASAVASFVGASYSGISQVRSVSLPRFAKGGSISNGTALVGEEGPELLSINGGRATVQPLTATLDSKSLQGALGGGQQVIKTEITFGGSLAQLAAVLQPLIVTETERRGEALVKA